MKCQFDYFNKQQMFPQSLTSFSPLCRTCAENELISLTIRELHQISREQSPVSTNRGVGGQTRGKQTPQHSTDKLTIGEELDQ